MKSLFKFSAFLAAAVGALLAFPVFAADAVATADPFGDLAVIGLGGLIVNANSLSSLTTAFKAAFNTGFRSVAPMWSKVATLVPSTTGTEDYAWLGQYPRLREWIGDRQVKNLSQSNYSIRNKDFEGTIGVKRTSIEDDQYGVYNPLMQEMGYAAATHPDELVFALLAAGFTTNCYDGQFFFDTDHPVGSGTASNHGGGAGNPWFLLDTRRPLKPLIWQKRKEYALVTRDNVEDPSVFDRNEFLYGVDGRGNVGFGFWQQAYGSKDTLNATNFDAGCAAMMAYTSDDGRPLGVSPSILVCGPSNRAAARALIEAETLASGASNTNFKAVELYVCPWLT